MANLVCRVGFGPKVNMYRATKNPKLTALEVPTIGNRTVIMYNEEKPVGAMIEHFQNGVKEFFRMDKTGKLLNNNKVAFPVEDLTYKNILHLFG